MPDFMIGGRRREMKSKKVFCEECVEEIPNNEVYWDEKRLYCGRCGSEIEQEGEFANVFDAIIGKSTANRLSRMEDDDYDDDEDEDEYEEDEDDEGVSFAEDDDDGPRNY